MGPGFAPKRNEEEDAKTQFESMQAKVREELKRMFRPEFLNRVDDIIVFHQLTTVEIRAIVTLLLKRVQGQLIEQEITLDVTEGALDLVAKKGYDKQYGARPLRRVIQNELEDKLAEGLLNGTYLPQSIVTVMAEGDNFVFSNVKRDLIIPVLPDGSADAPALPSPAAATDAE